MLVYSILVCSLVTFAASQNGKSWRDAAILNEARYLGSNGQFGSSVKQNDGLEYKEEADENGNRKGSYSYIDPTGERRTVTFTAGKDGFKASGSHLPSSAAVGSSAAAAPAAAPSAPLYSQNAAPSYSNAAPSYSNGLARASNGPALDSGFYNPDFDYPDGDQNKGADDGQYVPETPSYNAPRAQQQQSVSSLYKSAQPSYQPSQFGIPSADYNSQYNNQYNQYNSRNSYSQYSTPAPVPQYQQPAYNQYSSEAPAYQSYNQVNSDSSSYRSQSYPGKLSLNRSPDGFSYTFNTS